ncbi:MAG: 23S rRNA (guanosine(2251)-2'-O)-methyltransferase RlmB [Chloroflexota bacterium]
METRERPAVDRPAERRDGLPRIEGDLVFGPHSVVEALDSGREVHRVYVARRAESPTVAQVTELARKRGVPVIVVDRPALDRVSQHHQGIVAQVAAFQYTPFEEILERIGHRERPPLLLALDSIQDPQNLGSILRTAAAVSADGVVLTERRSALVTPTVVRVSAGGAQRVPIAVVTNLNRALELAKQRGLWVVGLAADGASDYTGADLTRGVVVVVGAEGKGIRPLVRAQCDFVVRLPMPGGMESLNAGVAAAVLLYEVLRQRNTDA